MTVRTNLPWIRIPAVMAVALAVAGCGTAGTPSGSPSPSAPSPSATGMPQSMPALQLAVLDSVGGHLVYCDPDRFPVQHGDPVSNARDRLPMIEADAAAFEAILRHEHLTPGGPFTDEQLVTINEDYKQMQAIELERAGDAFRFRVLVPAKVGSDVEQVAGTVTLSGNVRVEQRTPGQQPSCPICLAMGVRIATPEGWIPVQDLAAGTRVWTVDGTGHRVVGVVMRTGRSSAPLGHEMLRLTLGDGRTVTASPGHPTADGRRIGDLRLGDVLDGSVVVGAELTSYRHALTFDLLPSGPTGAYVADGVLLASTLAPGA